MRGKKISTKKQRFATIGMRVAETISPPLSKNEAEYAAET
jgi:hypothetical protein